MSVSALREEFLFWINVRKYSLYNVFSNSLLIHRRVILSFRFAFASWVLIFYNFICFCGCLFFANNMSVSESVYKTFIETIKCCCAACIHLEMNVASWCTLSCLQKMFCFFSRVLETCTLMILTISWFLTPIYLSCLQL